MDSNTDILRVIDIVHGTVVDGPGLRTSVYLAGCRHECPGCHNPQSWSFDAGHDMTVDELMAVVADDDMDVTLSGGDPLYQIDAVLSLCRAIRGAGKTVWVYTGFTYEQIFADGRLRPILDAADVLVDGPFVMVLRDTSLRFRGSSNQRIIDLARSVGDKLVLWSDDTALSSSLRAIDDWRYTGVKPLGD